MEGQPRELSPTEMARVKRAVTHYEVTREKARLCKPHEWPTHRNALIDAEQELIAVILNVGRAITIDGFRYIAVCGELLRTEFIPPKQANNRGRK